MSDAHSNSRRVTITATQSRGVADRLMNGVVLLLAAVFCLMFVAAGIAISFNHLTFTGSAGSALLGSTFLTLGLTCGYAVMAALFPGWTTFADMAHRRFRIMLMMVPTLFVLFFLILMIL